MSLTNWPSWLFVTAIVFLAADILLVITYFIWLYVKRRNGKDEKIPRSKCLINIKTDPLADVLVKEVEYTSEIFEIPGRTISFNGNERSLKPVPTMRVNKPFLRGESLDIDGYSKSSNGRKLSRIPRLGFELFYNFRTTELQVMLACGKYLPEYVNEQIVVSVLMSHCSASYHTARLDGPNPAFNEEFRFPLESRQISSDPPVTLKFNVWTIDRYSRKNPFGYVEASIEEILSQQGVTPGQGKGIVWRNIMESEMLTDESLEGEILISLSYLPAAQRISVMLIKAKDLILTSNDKDIQGKVSLLYREEEQKVLFSTFVPMSPNPEFNGEFVFNLTEFRNMSIDGIAIRVELQSRSNKRFMKSRSLGKFITGNSVAANQFGKDHWATMLTSRTSTSKWHSLEWAEM